MEERQQKILQGESVEQTKTSAAGGNMCGTAQQPLLGQATLRMLLSTKLSKPVVSAHP